MPSAEDVKSWYNQHYAAKGLESMRPAAAYPVFLDLLGATPGTRLLDVSCGTAPGGRLWARFRFRRFRRLTGTCLCFRQSQFRRRAAGLPVPVE